MNLFAAQKAPQLFIDIGVYTTNPRCDHMAVVKCPSPKRLIKLRDDHFDRRAQTASE